MANLFSELFSKKPAAAPAVKSGEMPAIVGTLVQEAAKRVIATPPAGDRLAALQQKMSGMNLVIEPKGEAAKPAAPEPSLTATVAEKQATGASPAEIKEALEKTDPNVAKQLVVPEQTQPGTENSVAINIPVQPNVTDTHVETVPEKEPVEAQKSTPEHVEISGREYVSVFLKEVNDYLEAGKELNQLIEKRKIDGIELGKSQEEIKILENDGSEIKDAIQKLLQVHDSESARNNLMNVLEAFQKYEKDFSNTKDEAEKKGLKLSNETLLKINSKKSDIQKMREALGGQEIVDNIMKWIRNGESFAQYAIKEKGIVTKPEIKSALVNLIRSDLPVVKAMIERNDMLGILQAMFSPTPQK